MATKEERQKQKDLPFEERVKLATEGVPTYLDDEATDRHVLFAGAKALMYMCGQEAEDFMECASKDPNPRACMPENVALTECTHKALDTISKECPHEVGELVGCLDEYRGYWFGTRCREREYELRVCLQAKLGFDIYREEQAIRLGPLRTWQRLRKLPPTPIVTDEKEFERDVTEYKNKNKI
jgi:hypothetical protein